MFKSENDDVARKFGVSDDPASKEKESHSRGSLYSRKPSNLSLVKSSQVGPADKDMEQQTWIARVSNECSQPRPAYGPAPGLEAQAISFVFSHYIIESTGDKAQSHFDYLPGFFAGGTANDLIQTSVVAVGLAGLSNIAHSELVMARARKTYGEALRKTNNALQSVSRAKDDGTLIAILLLTNFELITFEAEGSQESWKKHVDGASMLLRLRGQKQVESWLGLRLFTQLSGNILTSCLLHEIPVPETVIELRAELKQHIGTHGPIFDITGILIEFINSIFPLRAGGAPAAEIVPIMVQLDNKAREMSATMPYNWQYETLYTTGKSELAYKGYYHKYRDSWSARTWNVLRCLRLAINLVIRRSILSAPIRNETVPDVYMAQLETSSEVMILMAVDICATVPQHTGDLNSLLRQNAEQYQASKGAIKSPSGNSELDQLFEKLKRFDFPSSVPVRDNHSEALPAASCMNLLAPLRMAGQMPLASREMRVWIANRFRWIATTLGIRQAKVFAEQLEQMVQDGAARTYFVSKWGNP